MDNVRSGCHYVRLFCFTGFLGHTTCKLFLFCSQGSDLCDLWILVSFWASNKHVVYGKLLKNPQRKGSLHIGLQKVKEKLGKHAVISIGTYRNDVYLNLIWDQEWWTGRICNTILSFFIFTSWLADCFTRIIFYICYSCRNKSSPIIQPQIMDLDWCGSLKANVFHTASCQWSRQTLQQIENLILVLKKKETAVR